MAKSGPLNTPYEDCAVSPPGKTEADGASFGTPMKDAKAPTEDSIGGGVQFDKAGSSSGKADN